MMTQEGLGLYEWDGAPVHSDDRGLVRVRYAPFPLLRLLTLHCTRKKGVAEGEGAQQTTRRGPPANPGVFLVRKTQ